MFHWKIETVHIYIVTAIFLLLLFFYSFYWRTFFFPSPSFEFFTNEVARYYVIHMVGTEDRYKNIQEQEKALEKPITVFPAVIGKDLDIEAMREDGILKPEWTTYRYSISNEKEKTMRGEVGCYMSHMKLLEKIAEDAYDGWTIIFEDDIQLEPDFQARLLEQLPYLSEDVDMIYVGSLNQPTCEEEKRKGADLCEVENPWGTHAYMVNKRSAKKIRDLISYIDREIDIKYVSLIKEGKIDAFVIVPTLVKQNMDEFESMLEGDEVEKRSFLGN
jgi:GR25 family glycosyltransferase involved in LPS biosynthesis